MKKSLCLFIVVLPFLLNAMNYGIGDTLHVVAMDGLVIRSGPAINSERIGVLKTYEQVVVIDTSNFEAKTDSIFGFRGNWIKIKSFDDNSGFVFDAFLSTLPIIADPNQDFADSIPTTGPESLAAWLALSLKEYALNNFSGTNCNIRFTNNAKYATGAESFDIYKFEEGHMLICEYGWESIYCRLKLNNVRISEVYYLVKQFLPPDQERRKLWVFFHEPSLRNPEKFIDENNCFLVESNSGVFTNGFCLGELIADQKNGFTLIFRFAV